MKHITVELEEKIRAAKDANEAAAKAMQDRRDREADQHGEDLPEPMSLHEASAKVWAKALEWVLEQAGCK